MKNLANVSLIAFLAFALTGCTSNNLIVVAPKAETPPGSNITEHQFLLAQPCMLTPEEEKMNYASARGASPASGKLSQRAKEENMGGCAAVRFHLNANGTTADVQLMHESPKGYGFGDLEVSLVKASVYKEPEPADKNRWFYQIMVGMHVEPYDKLFSGGPEPFKKYAEFFQTH